MKHFSKIIPVLLLLITSGCKTAPTATLQPTLQPTLTLTHTPTAAFIATTVVQSTLTPTATQKISTPSPTPFLLKTIFPSACNDTSYERYTQISPNADWLAEYCSSDNLMQVSNQAGTKVFVVHSKEYFNDPFMPELGGSVKPVHWTRDSHFIYFTVMPEQWGDGGIQAIDELVPLLGRMNIENGETSRVFSGKVYFSFSPTERRLIEIQQYKHPVTLMIHDLQSGSVQKLIPDDASYSQAAQVVWSPDGSKLVFVAAFGSAYGDEVDEQNVQSFILVDVKTLSQRVILSKIPDIIKSIAWDENNIISYTIRNWDDRQQITNYSYNYQTETITSTP